LSETSTEDTTDTTELTAEEWLPDTVSHGGTPSDKPTRDTTDSTEETPDTTSTDTSTSTTETSGIESTELGPGEETRSESESRDKRMLPEEELFSEETELPTLTAEDTSSTTTDSETE